LTLIYLTLKPIKEQRHSRARFVHNLNHNSYMNNRGYTPVTPNVVGV